MAMHLNVVALATTEMFHVDPDEVVGYYIPFHLDDVSELVESRVFVGDFILGMEIVTLSGGTLTSRATVHRSRIPNNRVGVLPNVPSGGQLQGVSVGLAIYRGGGIWEQLGSTSAIGPGQPSTFNVAWSDARFPVNGFIRHTWGTSRNVFFTLLSM